MAVVSFQRPGDAALARAKYNGKIVDGRKYLVLLRTGLCLTLRLILPCDIGRPIKIEIVKDEDDKPRAPEKAPVPSLLQRLGGVVPPKAAAAPPTCVHCCSLQ